MKAVNVESIMEIKGMELPVGTEIFVGNSQRWLVEQNNDGGNIQFKALDFNVDLVAVDYDLWLKKQRVERFNQNRIAENAKTYQYKPRFIRARAAKKIYSQPITFDF